MNSELEPLPRASPPEGAMASSAQIASKSKSNLAFALACLPAVRRRDMISFYAFCRIVDDIADDPAVPEPEKRITLNRWRHAVLNEGQGVCDAVLSEVVALPAKYGFSSHLLAEIIDGVASDLTNVRYPTIDALLAYCYKVASVVGLVSIHIFGHRDPRCREYAIALGYALQLTNIMRDVGEDARDSGRIYLPLDELQRFGVSEDDILNGRYSEGFGPMMEFQFQRARGYYEEAAALLPAVDRKNMIASEMMAQIYRELLEKLRSTGYRVFDRRTKLSRLRKSIILGGYLLRSLIGAV